MGAGTAGRRGSMGAPFSIIVLGASAGGLDALRRILRELPADLPVPVVVVRHLHPRHRSRMPELLARHTALRVRVAEHGDPLEPGTVYLPVPDRHLVVTPDRTIELVASEPTRTERPSIDVLFGSVANSHRGAVIAVVLSGTGSDGALGAKAVKHAGGTVIVQDGRSADFGQMPRAAAEDGAADLVLPVGRIGVTLRGMVRGDHVRP